MLKWFDQHGRKHLPWQQNPTPYRVWVSEIMLQQTQVTTVIPYFERFMRNFPDTLALASASQDEVLDHWSGLGYYARGRNLHRAAQTIVREYQGKLPENIDALMALPGIGRSTAGAILSLACQQHHAILDGNVKRVLCRHYKVDGWYGQSGVEKQLWALSGALTPARRTAAYNQAMMDMGATLCTRRQPNCSSCPIQKSCGACASGDPLQWPQKKPKKDKPKRSVWMLMIEDDEHRVWMERRPPSGVWGGLWGFKECQSETEANTLIHTLQPIDSEVWAPVKHVFTHFELSIFPIHIRLNGIDSPSMINDSDGRWVKPGESVGGMAAPVERLLDKLHLPLLTDA